MYDQKSEQHEEKKVERVTQGKSISAFHKSPSTPKADYRSILGLKENNSGIPQRERQYPVDTRQSTVQRKQNNTGLPDNLKSGIENLSGYSMDDVNVHYNSSKPTQLQAHAYAQGADIYLGPGQEKHLPHEAWHVVQQKQGRVKSTMQIKDKVNVNDDKGLEKEADVMGAKALQSMTSSVRESTSVSMQFSRAPTPNITKSHAAPIQMVAIQVHRDNDDRVRYVQLSQERGPRAFAVTMGAHTTAYAVIQDKIRSLLHGLDLAAVATEMRRWRDNLPDVAVELNSQLQANHYTTARNAYYALTNGAHPTSWGEVQAALVHYMNAHDFIPGSTLDTGFTGGAAERGPLKKLREYENGTGALSEEEARTAILGLYDGANVARYAGDRRNPGSRTTARVNPDENDQTLSQRYWDTHLNTISQTYPRAYARSRLAPGVTTPGTQRLIKQERAKYYALYVDDWTHVYNEIKRHKEERRWAGLHSSIRQSLLKILVGRYDKVASIANDAEGLPGHLNHFNRVITPLHDAINTDNATNTKISPATTGRGRREQVVPYSRNNAVADGKMLDDRWASVKDYEQWQGTTQTNDRGVVYGPNQIVVTNDDINIDLLPAPAIPGTRNILFAAPTADWVDASEVTIQIQQNTAGLIDDVKIADRPASPFRGTMGDHSSAWLVTKKHMAQVIRGVPPHNNTLAEAVTDLHTEYTNTVTLCNAMCAYPFGVQGIDAAWRYDQALQKYDNVRGWSDSATKVAMLAGHILTMHNQIPGVTNEQGGVPHGHNEATYYANLAADNANGIHDDSVIRESVRGLWDWGYRNNSNPLWRAHKDKLAALFPRIAANIQAVD